MSVNNVANKIKGKAWTNCKPQYDVVRDIIAQLKPFNNSPTIKNYYLNGTSCNASEQQLISAFLKLRRKRLIEKEVNNLTEKLLKNLDKK